MKAANSNTKLLRIALTMVLYLTIGLALCVAVSAGVYWASGAAPNQVRMFVERYGTPVGTAPKLGPPPLSMFEPFNAGSSWYQIQGRELTESPERLIPLITREPGATTNWHSAMDGVMYVRVGWPLRWAGGTAWLYEGNGLSASNRPQDPNLPHNKNYGTVLDLRPSLPLLDMSVWPRYVPLRILWWNLLWCVAIYTAAVVAVHRLIWCPWRWWRRRGRCQGCGYSVAGLTANVCPECGVTRAAADTV